MSRTVYYRQCQLVRPHGRGEMRQTSWIPEAFAVVGKVLRLREADDWQDGWVVSAVGPFRRAFEELPDPHGDIKRHRRATGDALPKVSG
jgi:hypothetical protein